MSRYRYEIRFQKDGDLRLTSHRDLVRLWERLLRRAELELSFSEGFHPKPRMTFPSALPLGVRGLDEVVEIELTVLLDPAALQARLVPQAPPGLELRSVRCLAANTRRPRIARLDYELAVPPERAPQVARRLAELQHESTWFVTRPDRPAPVDVRGGLERLELAAGQLQISVRDETVRPRDILGLLQLNDLETRGGVLTRTRVELAR